MEADPIGLEGGLNPYAYAGSNPVMNVDPSGLMNMLDGAGLSDAWVNNLDNQMWMNQQQIMIERAAANIDRGLSYNGTGTKDYITYNSSLTGMLAMDIRNLPLGLGPNGITTAEQVYPTKAGRPYSQQDIADGLQTVGNAADIGAVACTFSVICSPAAPAIGFVGLGAGTAGTLLDQTKTPTQKAIGIIVPNVVGKVGTRVVANPTISQKVADAYGTIVDKLTGTTIDSVYKCRKNKNC